jgi:hypothetical protein
VEAAGRGDRSMQQSPQDRHRTRVGRRTRVARRTQVAHQTQVGRRTRVGRQTQVRRRSRALQTDQRLSMPSSATWPSRTSLTVTTFAPMTASRIHRQGGDHASAPQRKHQLNHSSVQRRSLTGLGIPAELFGLQVGVQ